MNKVEYLCCLFAKSTKYVPVSEGILVRFQTEKVNAVAKLFSAPLGICHQYALEGSAQTTGSTGGFDSLFKKGGIILAKGGNNF